MRKAKSKQLLVWPFRHQFNIFQQQLCQKTMINVMILSINCFAAAAKVCIDSHLYDFYLSSSSSSSARFLSSWQFFFSLPWLWFYKRSLRPLIKIPKFTYFTNRFEFIFQLTSKQQEDKNHDDNYFTNSSIYVHISPSYTKYAPLKLWLLKLS